MAANTNTDEMLTNHTKFTSSLIKSGDWVNEHNKVSDVTTAQQKN